MVEINPTPIPTPSLKREGYSVQKIAPYRLDIIRHPALDAGSVRIKTIGQ